MSLEVKQETQELLAPPTYTPSTSAGPTGELVPVVPLLAPHLSDEEYFLEHRRRLFAGMKIHRSKQTGLLLLRKLIRLELLIFLAWTLFTTFHEELFEDAEVANILNGAHLFIALVPAVMVLLVHLKRKSAARRLARADAAQGGAVQLSGSEETTA